MYINTNTRSRGLQHHRSSCQLCAAHRNLKPGSFRALVHGGNGAHLCFTVSFENSFPSLFRNLLLLPRCPYFTPTLYLRHHCAQAAVGVPIPVKISAFHRKRGVLLKPTGRRSRQRLYKMLACRVVSPVHVQSVGMQSGFSSACTKCWHAEYFLLWQRERA